MEHAPGSHDRERADCDLCASAGSVEFGLCQVCLEPDREAEQPAA